MISLIVGSSAGLGRALAEELACRGHDIVITGRDERDLLALAADLKIRFQHQVYPMPLLLERTQILQFREQVKKTVGRIDNLFLVAGCSDIDRDFQKLSPLESMDLVENNFSAPVALALAFLEDIESSPSGNIVGIGSVASARPRNQNTVYASAKTGFEFFFGGLRQNAVGKSYFTQFYRIGFMRTSMTFGQQSLIPYAQTSVLATQIANNLNRDKGIVYLPRFWWVLATIYQFLPWFIFKRMHRKG